MPADAETGVDQHPRGGGEELSEHQPEEEGPEAHEPLQPAVAAHQAVGDPAQQHAEPEVVHHRPTAADEVAQRRERLPEHTPLLRDQGPHRRRAHSQREQRVEARRAGRSESRPSPPDSGACRSRSADYRVRGRKSLVGDIVRVRIKVEVLVVFGRVKGKTERFQASGPTDDGRTHPRV